MRGMNNGPMTDYPFNAGIPHGDNRERMVCGDCGWIHYVNPKIVVGAVCTWEDKFLLCRRAIEPRSGYWTIPAGFLEERETVEQGACREAKEEALADIEINALLGVYSIPRISQVQMIFRAALRNPNVGVGDESEEVELVTWEEIPWDDLAFPSVTWSLNHFHEVRGRETFAPFTAPVIY